MDYKKKVFFFAKKMVYSDTIKNSWRGYYGLFSGVIKIT